jgi:uncharacterized protein
VLRGVAVGGILLANVLVFFGLLLPGNERTPDGLDATLEFLEHVLVEGKFYSIFSLLFGIGFGLQLTRRGEAAIGRFRRRLRVLMVIGAIHAIFIWAGDILLLYALLGLAMSWFARRSDRSLLRWTTGLLATHAAMYALALALWTVLGAGAAVPAAPPSGAPVAEQPADDIPPEVLSRIRAVGTGGVTDAFIGNLIFLAGRWADLFVTMRFPKVLGMFVLGLWLVRRGIATDPAAHADLLRRWRWIGLSGGLAANLVAAWALTRWGYLPPSTGGLLAVVGQAIGFPLLAIGYASAIVLAAASGRRVLGWFAPVGRMALTNYLMHSVVCVTLSYGFGFGLFGRIGVAQALAIAVLIVAVQIPVSRWWLSRHDQGPMEWVWRRFTYGQPLLIRGSS